ncbi:hydrogenase expression/formation protein [Ideonella sp. A 288]|uniref:hydrogenase expression/formation protein n=1 Tax=Ideonella sp. A 288 TaxID=1962181 RepID=UPI000B4B6D07|nr:hydrogenase expression/formation protein [Ideonella sp. A 288]
MTAFASAKPFPIPVVAAYVPELAHEDDGLDYLPMPSGMDTYRAPPLPEPEELAGHAGAVRVLREALAQLDKATRGEPAAAVSLAGLSPDDLALVNQVLGEGEVSAQVLAAPDGGQHAAQAQGHAQVQESVFAGVWRVVEVRPDGQVHDRIEVGDVPALLRQAARDDAAAPRAAVLAPPPGMVNVPSILAELEDQRARWQPGDATHVVNLTLLPLAPADIGYLDHVLGTGRVLILSRGYGNCRITDTQVPNTWRVVYYNSQDTVILNSVEVTAMPEVACAALEDLIDSHERLAEVLAWVEQG